jgi:hypothetical protein
VADRTRSGALLHDVGRVAVSNAVWEKPGPLTRRGNGGDGPALGIGGVRSRVERMRLMNAICRLVELAPALTRSVSSASIG